MSISTTEARLHEALNRLLENKPTKVKAKTKLTLNKINKEAGLGNSYIHRFPEFMKYAKPLMDVYNLTREKVIENGLGIDAIASLSETNNAESDLARERRLKNKYRQERNSAIEARKLMESKYYEVVFKLLSVQKDLASYRSTVAPLK